MEHKIGEIVTLTDGRKAEVVEEIVLDSCEGCVFINVDCIKSPCVAYDRTDGKNIIYKEVKEADSQPL